MAIRRLPNEYQPLVKMTLENGIKMTVQDVIGIAIPSVVYGYVQSMQTLISRSLLQAFSIIYFFVGSHPGLPASQSSSKEKSENNIVGLEVNSI